MVVGLKSHAGIHRFDPLALGSSGLAEFDAPASEDVAGLDVAGVFDVNVPVYISWLCIMPMSVQSMDLACGLDGCLRLLVCWDC